MIQLLFLVIFSEMAVIFVLSFKTPLRKVVIMGLDRVKRGRGPVIVKTVAGTVSVVTMSSVYSMMKIRKRWIDDGAVNPTDQVLMVKHLLEATLMGGVLFLALMIDRLHHYIRELRLRRKNMEAAKKQGLGFEDGKPGGSDKVKALEEEVTTLRAKLKQLESDLETKTKEMNAAEANAVALRKKSEDFLLEYDQLKSDLGTKTKELNAAEANAVALRKQSEDFLVEYDRLKSDLETKTKELNAAEANAVALRKQSEDFLLEYDRLLEENQNLRNQLQSLDQSLSRSGSKKNT